MKNTSLMMFEEHRNDVTEDLKFCFSSKQSLFILYNYINEIFTNPNPVIQLLYISEYIPYYTKLIDEFDANCLDYHYSELLLKQIRLVILLELDDSLKNSLITSQEKLREKICELKQVIKGLNSSNLLTSKLFFPLLEENYIKNNSIPFGILESITIDIKKNDNDVFIIIPSGKNIEENILQQVHISYQLALEYIKKQTSLKKTTHSVIINFDNRLGDYTGNSLGVALTIGIIEKFLLLYNLPYNVFIKNNIASTGGVDSLGNILPVSEKVIEEKTELVFFSPINIFIVPDKDKSFAQRRLEELKTIYPEKKLDIVGVSDLEDLFNRRNLIDIKKQNPIKRTTKALLSNKLVSILLLILFVISGIYIWTNIDNNPKQIVDTGSQIRVLNNNGRTLWNVPIRLEPMLKFEKFYNSFIRLIDIDEDGNNEILFSDIRTNTSLICLNFNGDTLWSYAFKDSLVSKRETMLPLYSIRMFDTLKVDGNTYLCCLTKNSPSYASALFFINIKNGKRSLKTLYNAGHLEELLIERNYLKGHRIIISGHNNGLELAFLAIIKMRDMQGCLPTSDEYMFNDMVVPKLVSYYLFPRSDYSLFLKGRMNGTALGYLRKDELVNLYSFGVIESGISYFTNVNLEYKLKPDLVTFYSIISNQFRSERDSLVKKGFLSPPYSDTKEYRQKLVDNILYYHKGKFLHRDEYLKTMKINLNE